MRVLVMFDLPVLTAEERREYRMFRKHLLENGFMMMQESVYCKLVPNSSVAEGLVENLRKNKPSSGLVQAIRVTEKQYEKMDFIVGQIKQDVIDSDERIVFL